MEEERVEQSTAEDKGEDAPSSNASDDVAQEISRLVEAMARAARSVWSSEQRHQLETDLRRCLGSLVGNVEDALSRFSQSEQGKELHEHASKVADRVSKSALAAELKDGLAQGIKTGCHRGAKVRRRPGKAGGGNSSPPGHPSRTGKAKRRNRDMQGGGQPAFAAGAGMAFRGARR